MLYAFPDVGRFGLAHSLLAWGRARVWAKEHGAAPLAPDWLKLRVGPYLRRERDKRNYFLLFGSGGAIAGMRKRLLMWRLPKIDESDVGRSVEPNAVSKIVVFRSVPDNDINRDFAALKNHASFLKAELTAMTHPRYRPTEDSLPHIAVHVRLGDFAVATEEELRAGKQNVRLPMEWYPAAIEAVRSAVGGDIAVRVYSDGSDEELAPLLALPQTSRSPARAAITDMLAISNATALIGSGSGFSLWGSFLGQVPRISYPGQLLVRVLDEPAHEITLAADENLPTHFVEELTARIGRATEREFA